MQPLDFTLEPPRVTEFTRLTSRTSKLLRSRVEKQLQRDQQCLNTPLDLEPASHASVVSACDDLLATIDNFKQAQKDLDALKAYFYAAEEHATERLSLHHALLSPIRRLPNEVLQLIFIQVHASSNENAQFNPITAQVCSYWRRVAEATPFLWTSIDIDLSTPEGVDASLDKAEEKFQRAKIRLVSVRLSQRKSAISDSMRYAYLEDGDKPSDSRHLAASVALLIKHHDRLESITIAHRTGLCDISHHLASQCPPTTDLKFKNLRMLRILPEAWNVHSSHVQALCDASPALEKLHLRTVPESLGVRWENITEFTGIVEEGALAVLCSRARRLQRAHIHGSAWNEMIQSPLPTPNAYAFDCLTSLSLYLSDVCLSKLASVPRPPVLRHLLLNGGKDRYWESSGNHLISFLQAWGSELEYLANGFAVNTDELKSALQATPKLQGVRLRTEAVIPPSIFTILPALTHLELHAAVHNAKGANSQARIRKLLSRPLKPKSLKRLALRSVAFYPSLERSYDESELPESVKESWDQLSQGLTSVGLHVHEYRNLSRRRQTDVEFGFDTRFFKERGLD